MKIEIEVTDPADVSAILNLLAGKGDWPGQPVLTPSEASEGERVEKHAEQEAPKKRGPGRPRMTDEEKAEAARRRAEAKKQKEAEEAEEAAKAAKEAEEDDSVEEPEPITEDDLEEDTGKAAALEDDEDDDSDKDPMEEAVELATKYLRDGNGKEVRRALKSVGASRVSDLKGAKVQEFLEIIKSI